MIYNPFRNLGLKAISVALALLIWLSVSGEQIVERSLLVPLELQIPEQLEVVDLPPQTVAVRVRGGSGVLSHMNPGDVVAVLDLSAARPGRGLFPMTVDRVHAPVGVEVTQVMPSSIALELERRGSRQVRVVPTLEGEPAAGYEVHSYAVQPQSVDVAGPENVLRQLTKVITEPVSIAGASQPVRKTVAVGVVVPSLRLKTPGMKAVVTVDIRPVQGSRTFTGIPVRTRQVPAKRTVVVTPSHCSVTVNGAVPAFAGLAADRFEAFVDLAAKTPGRYNLRVQVEPPPNVQVVQVQPPNVAVRIK